MSDPRTGNWLVFNGEIYNFKDLREELKASGICFQSDSDTEVLLKAYGAWGTDSISRCSGMFAFALWDARQECLILGRDRLGVKPLYFTVKAGEIAFASELRSLLLSGVVASKLSSLGLLSYLQFGSTQEPETILEGIRMVPAGHFAVWKHGALKLHQYWSLRDAFAGQSPVQTKSADLAGEVRAALARAVALRLISDAPIGVFLSGGLDSASVACLAAQQADRPIRTVSVVFPEGTYSEKRFADLVSRRYATQHTEVCLSSQDFLSMLPQALEAMDQPTFDAVNTYVVSSQARQAGLTVALSGIGGDELFGGYASFRRIPHLRQIRRWLPRAARKPASWLVIRSGRDSDQARKLSRWMNGELEFAGGAELLTRELFSTQACEQLAPALTGIGFSPAVTVPEPLDDFNSISLFELSGYLKNVLLRDTDVMGMAHSLEVREPLLDHNLIELVARLPGQLKADGGRKPLLSQAMAADLPREIVGRRKMGFTLPFSQWLKGPLRANVEDVLFDKTTGGQLCEFLDAQAVATSWTRFLNGSGTWVRPWSLYVLKQWGDRWL